jgi:apoptosis-inducing factor 3
MALPDFANGVSMDQVPDGGMLRGTVGEDTVVLARRGDEFFAFGANCTHYGGPLDEGLLVGDEVRCPWHHACFSIRSGEVLRPPAIDPIPCWRVERAEGKLFVREKLEPAAHKPVLTNTGERQLPSSVVIVGGGAAGFSAAHTLRREGYEGPITMISADESAPYDRPNLSKEYLAGQAQEEWIPLRSPEYYAEQKIDLVLNARVASLDAANKRIQTDDGRTYEFGALLLATGAEPVHLAVPGASDSRPSTPTTGVPGTPQVLYLRTFADSQAIVEKAASARRVVVAGASFIGLEVAASLRERGIEVHVVAPDKQPLERVMGTEVGKFIRGLHEEHGTVFHLGETVARVEGPRAWLSGGASVEVDFLVLGVGVRPSVALAEQAGLKTDRGVVVNEYLETSAPGIFAAGDIARWPDAYSGELIRIEHWVVAECQGQTAARNILGRRERFTTVPFFWTRQFDVSLDYSGHAEKWDAIEIDGSLEAKDCAVRYKLGGRTMATLTISRSLQSLQAEAEMEASAGAGSRPRTGDREHAA